ncbi:MAG: dual specificity protein phosphatase family protein [Candidatus Binatia bacterium]
MREWYGLLGPAPRATEHPTVSEIRGGLLVGSYPLPADVPWLRDVHRVTAVVNLQDDADLAAKGLRLTGLEHAYRTHGVAFHRVAVTDGDVAGLAARLGEIVAVLARLLDAGDRVFLHCNAGFNRAPTAAIAYLHAHGGMSLPEAIAFVKARRSCVPYAEALEAAARTGLTAR